MLHSRSIIRARGKDARPLDTEVGGFGAAGDQNPEGLASEKGEGRAAEARTQGHPKESRPSLLWILTVLEFALHAVRAMQEPCGSHKGVLRGLRVVPRAIKSERFGDTVIHIRSYYSTSKGVTWHLLEPEGIVRDPSLDFLDCLLGQFERTLNTVATVDARAGSNPNMAALVRCEVM